MIFRVSPLEDQVFAGALMWVFGTFVYMVPAVILTVRLLSGETALSGNQAATHGRKPASQTYDHSPAEIA
jgi:cytochrome c oxidase assembly factor CtaG